MKVSRKILSVLLTAALLLSLFSAVPVFAAESEDENDFQSVQLSYTDENGYFYSKLDGPDVLAQVGNSAYPSSYNSAELGYITPVRDQGSTGTCWAHSVMAACESSMIIAGQASADADLSELHLAYSAFHTPADRLGLFDATVVCEKSNAQKTWIDEGNFYYAPMYVLASWQGVVEEDANHGQFSSKKFDIWPNYAFEVYNKDALFSLNSMHVQNIYNVYPVCRDEMKKLIMEYGAGSMQIFTGYQFENSSLNEFTSTYFNSDIFIGVDHAVAVVGWDDNYPRENCEVNGVMPYEDGAWLIKNSWGTSSGNNGYYWVSYEDTSINNYPVSFYSLEYADNYDNNYQYDDIFNTDACFDDYDDLIGIVGGGTMANVYTARKDEEVLKAVGFFTQNENLTYEIDIYRGVDENGMPQGEPVASKKGTEQYMGYHTVNLDSPVSLEKGEKFVVAIKLYDETTPDIPIVFSIDSVVFDDRYTKNTEYGESLFMYSGGEWFDIKDCVNCNFRIKAFTDSKEEESAPAEDLYYSFGGVSRDELKYELGKKYSDALEIAYNSFGVYSSDSLSELQNIVSYVESGMLSDYSDLFLAMDFSSASDEIDRCIDALEPFDISELIGDYYVDDESIPLISTLDGYENYINAYNSVVERAEDEGVNYENAIEFIEIASKAYLDIMHEAVRAGFNFSYLQNFGDADNNGNVNIKDCTLIQKYLVNLVESDYYIINNANVDRDYDITIKDVTAIQKYIADIIEYMPVYDTQFGIDESGTLPEPTAVDKETAIANLQNAVDAVEMVYGEDLLMTFTEVSYLTVGVMLSDAKEVLNSPEDYHPQVIDFKARNLLWCYSSIGAAG